MVFVKMLMVEERLNLNFTIISFFQSSSCISDREEEDIYDFANKYQGTTATTTREQLHLQQQQQQQSRFGHPRMFQTASPRSSKPTSPATSSLAEQRSSSKLSPSG